MDELDPPLEALDFVKLDVQGTEHVVIGGMERTISRFRPPMLVEFWPAGIRERGDRPADVISLYQALQYSIAVLGAPGMNGNIRPDALVEFADESEFCDLLLTPR